MNLQELDLVELHDDEAQGIEGGLHPAFWVAVAWSAWDNMDDIINGLSDGYNGR